MTARQIVVVDTETNGLDPDRHQAVEVAWWNLDTGERGVFIPQHNVSMVLHDADVRALQINRYVDRIAGQKQDNGRETVGLFQQLDGNTLAGSNPAFDAAMLRKVFAGTRRGADPPGVVPWHHRMWDLSAYAAGVLGLEELPGLAKVCELLEIEPGDHTAEADVTACGLCFKKLRAMRL